MLHLFRLMAFARADVDFGGAGSAGVVAEPVRVGERSVRDQLPPIDPSPPFLFFHHARQWRIVGGDNGAPTLLPAIQQASCEPGVDRVDEYGDPAGMIAERRRNGWTFIPQEWATPGDTPDKAAGYVRRVKVRGGFAHLTAWQSVRILAGAPSWKVDEASYHRWLRRLMAEGLISAPEPEILEQMLERSKERLQRAGSRDMNNATARDLHRRAEREVELLERVAAGGLAALDEDREAALAAELELIRARRAGVSGG